MDRLHHDYRLLFFVACIVTSSYRASGLECHSCNSLGVGNSHLNDDCVTFGNSKIQTQSCRVGKGQVARCVVFKGSVTLDPPFIDPKTASGTYRRCAVFDINEAPADGCYAATEIPGDVLYRIFAVTNFLGAKKFVLGKSCYCSTDRCDPENPVTETPTKPSPAQTKFPIVPSEVLPTDLSLFSSMPAQTQFPIVPSEVLPTDLSIFSNIPAQNSPPILPTKVLVPPTDLSRITRIPTKNPSPNVPTEEVLTDLIPGSSLPSKNPSPNVPTEEVFTDLSQGSSLPGFECYFCNALGIGDSHFNNDCVMFDANKIGSEPCRVGDGQVGRCVVFKGAVTIEMPLFGLLPQKASGTFRECVAFEANEAPADGCYQATQIPSHILGTVFSMTSLLGVDQYVQGESCYCSTPRCNSDLAPMREASPRQGNGGAAKLCHTCVYIMVAILLPLMRRIF